MDKKRETNSVEDISKSPMMPYGKRPVLNAEKNTEIDAKDYDTGYVSSIYHMYTNIICN